MTLKFSWNKFLNPCDTKEGIVQDNNVSENKLVEIIMNIPGCSESDMGDIRYWLKQDDDEILDFNFD